MPTNGAVHPRAWAPLSRTEESHANPGSWMSLANDAPKAEARQKGTGSVIPFIRTVWRGKATKTESRQGVVKGYRRGG